METIVRILISTYLLMILAYVVFYASVIYSWLSHKSDFQKEVIDGISCSVLVPFRNEIAHVTALVRSLKQLDLSSLLVEFIFIDDHSEDGSMDKLRSELQGSSLNASFLTLPANELGKKKALDFGIKHAQGDVIITTDFDCTFQPNWLQSIATCFDDQNLQMLVSPVSFSRSQGLWGCISNFEFHAVQMITGFFVRKKVFALSNGANLAFTKSAYQHVGGYDGSYHIPSGDDLFLMQKVAKMFPEGVKYNEFAEGMVTTSGPDTLYGILKQKVRWASKWAEVKSPALSSLAVFTFLVHAFFLVISLFLMSNELSFGWDFFLIGFMVKMIVDFFVLAVYASFCNQKVYFLNYILSAAIYPFYVILIGSLSLIKKYEWKDRKYK